MKAKVGDIIAISWLDIVSEDDSLFELEALRLEPFLFVSYGRLLANDRKHPHQRYCVLTIVCRAKVSKRLY